MYCDRKYQQLKYALELYYHVDVIHGTKPSFALFLGRPSYTFHGMTLMFNLQNATTIVFTRDTIQVTAQSSFKSLLSHHSSHYSVIIQVTAQSPFRSLLSHHSSHYSVTIWVTAQSPFESLLIRNSSHRPASSWLPKSILIVNTCMCVRVKKTFVKAHQPLQQKK